MAATTKAPPFTFYTNPLAFNPAKPAVMIAEKGFSPKVVKVDLLGGQTLQPWFMKLNPTAAVPVVVDAQNKVILESMVICQWLDGLDGQPLGGDQVDRTWVNSFVQEIDTFDGNLWAFAKMPPSMHKTLEGLDKYRVKVAEANAQRAPELKQAYEAKIANMSKLLAQAKEPEKVSQCEGILAQLLDKAEARLAAAAPPASQQPGGGPFLGGPAYSIADAMLAPVLYRVTTFGQHKELIASRMALAAYMRRMRERPSWKAAFGENDSTFGKLAWFLPALLKSKIFPLLGRY